MKFETKLTALCPPTSVVATRAIDGAHEFEQFGMMTGGTAEIAAEYLHLTRIQLKS
jgi:hypothetical protein